MKKSTKKSLDLNKKYIKKICNLSLPEGFTFDMDTYLDREQKKVCLMGLIQLSSLDVNKISNRRDFIDIHGWKLFSYLWKHVDNTLEGAKVRLLYALDTEEILRPTNFVVSSCENNIYVFSSNEELIRKYNNLINPYK